MCLALLERTNALGFVRANKRTLLPSYSSKLSYDTSLRREANADGALILRREAENNKDSKRGVICRLIIISKISL